MYRISSLFALAFMAGCQVHPISTDHSPRAEQKQICFVVEDIDNLDGSIELWLKNDSAEMPDAGDWFPGRAANIGDRRQCVTTGFLISDGDPIRVNGRYKLHGDSNWHYLSEFIYGEAYSHVLLDTFEVDGVNQFAEIIDNGHPDEHGYSTGVDDGFTYRAPRPGR